MDNVPKFIAMRAGFTQLMNAIIPNYKMPSCRTLGRHIDHMMGMAVEDLKALLHALEERGVVFGVSGDLWSSRNQYGFFGILLHFIDPASHQLMEVTAAISYMPGPHTADNCRDVLERELFVNLGLKRNSLISMTADTGSNIKKLVNCFDLFEFPLGCACHLLQLTIRESLYGRKKWHPEGIPELKELIVTAKSFVGYTRYGHPSG
jgi:hypothetical protein